MAYRRRRRKKRMSKGYYLTVKKGRRTWRLKTCFKSMASRARAKRALRMLGWR
jgi:hypothetical protein